MILFPSADGTVSAPPLLLVPAADVVSVRVWHELQPIASNRFDPLTASAVPARAASRGGTFVERLNAAKMSMSLSASSTSGTVSKSATERPIDVFSTGWRRL